MAIGYLDIGLPYNESFQKPCHCGQKVGYNEKISFGIGGSGHRNFGTVMRFIRKMPGLFKHPNRAAGTNLMRIINLEDRAQLDEIDNLSATEPVVILKHSTRCGISAMIWKRLKADWPDLLGSKQLFFLDLIQYRQISNEIAERYKVPHESPQILVIQNGQCTYSASHNAIDAKDIQEELNA